MKNSGVFSKVRDTENGARKTEEGEGKKTTISFVVLPVKGKKRREEWVRENHFHSNS